MLEAYLSTFIQEIYILLLERLTALGDLIAYIEYIVRYYHVGHTMSHRKIGIKFTRGKLERKFSKGFNSV